MHHYTEGQSPAASVATSSQPVLPLAAAAASSKPAPRPMASSRYDKAQTEIAKFQLGVKQLTTEPDELSNTISTMYVSLRQLLGTNDADEFIKKLKQPALLLISGKKNPQEISHSPSDKKEKDSSSKEKPISRRDSLINSFSALSAIKEKATSKNTSSPSKEKRNSSAGEEDIATRVLLLTDPFFEPIRQAIQSITAMQQRIASLKNAAHNHDALLQHCRFLISHYEAYIAKACNVTGPERIKLLEPRPEIKGVGIGCHFLTYETACAIVSVNPNTGQTERFNEFGGGRTNKVGSSFFKPTIQCAGHEFKVNCDNNVSPGPESPQVTCLKVTLIPKGKKIPEEYFVIASHEVAGRNLLDIINKEPHLISRIAPRNYSANLVGSLRDNPGDHKADNFLAKTVEGDESDPRALELVCVDNADGTMPPFCLIQSENNKHLLRGKNILYIMPHAEYPIDPAFCAEFTAELPEVRLINWLREMQAKNREFQTYIDQGIFTQQQLSEQNLPIKLNPNTVADRYITDCILYDLLKNPHAGLTHANVLKAVNEELATCYQIIREKFAGKLKDAIIPLGKESFYAEDILDLRNAEHRRLLEKIKNKYRQGFFANFDNLTQTIPEAMEQCIRIIQFGKRTAEEQRTILQSLCDLEDLSHLNLLDCSVLDNEWLRRLTFRHRNLQSVSLSGKHTVTKDGLFALINTHHNLTISLNINSHYTIDDWKEVCSCATRFNLLVPNPSPDSNQPCSIPVKPLPDREKQIEYLGYAATCGDVRVLQFLFQNGYRGDGVTNNRKRNLFHQAITSPAKCRSMEIITFLLSRESQDSPLPRENSGSAVKGENPVGPENLMHSVDLDHNSSLHLACQEGWLEVINLLLSKNASLLARNSQGQTPLHKLIEYKHCAILKNIFERFPAQKTTFLEAKDENGRTLVHQAALSGDPDILQFILSLGADVNQRDHYGNTPLHLAITARHPLPIIQLLFAHNADTTLKNSTITPPNPPQPGRDAYHHAMHLNTSRDTSTFGPIEKKYEEQKKSKRVEPFSAFRSIANQLSKELQVVFNDKSITIIPLNLTEETVSIVDFIDFLDKILKEFCQNEAVLLQILLAIAPYYSQLSCLPISSEVATHLLVTTLSQQKRINVALIDYLLRSGANLTNTGKTKSSALHILCKNPTAPSIEVFDSLLSCSQMPPNLRSQMPPNLLDVDGNTPLFLIFGWADEHPELAIDVMKRFKMHGADFKKLDAVGRNLVHKITQLPKASPLLLDALFALEKCDSTLADSTGNTPLYNILDWCDSSKVNDSDGKILLTAKTAIQKLLQYGASIEQGNMVTKETPLDTAMKRNKPRTFGMLVDLGAGKSANLDKLKKFLDDYEKNEIWKEKVKEWRKKLSSFHPALEVNRDGPTFMAPTQKAGASPPPAAAAAPKNGDELYLSARSHGRLLGRGPGDRTAVVIKRGDNPPAQQLPPNNTNPSASP